jgi:WD40 repeat protein
MDAEKLARLEDNLYNQTPVVGDLIRKIAAKQLIDLKTPASVQLLAKALVFSKDQNVKKMVLNALRDIKLQERNSIDIVCQVWAENRDRELGNFIKLKGWVASKPIQLRVLLALSIGWKGVIEEQGTSVVLPLLNLLGDREITISDPAKKWALSFTNPDLQAEVCRLASEEDNQTALEIANQAGYKPATPTQTALFYFLTEQWDKYQEIDPQQKLLADIYYSSSEELQKRIDRKGETRKRIEWVWMILGGKEGKHLAAIDNNKWPKIIDFLSSGRYWSEMWSLALITPVAWTIEILKTLQNNRWLPKTPEVKISYYNWLKLAKQCPKQPPKGKLVRCTRILEGHTRSIESILITPESQLLISAGDNLIRIWDLQKGELVSSLKGHLKSVTSLALSEDGRLLASGGRDKTICVWRLPEGNLVQNFSTNVVSVYCLAMTRDGNLLTTGSYQEARLWEYPTSRLLKSLKGHKREVQSLVISPDDSLLVTGGGPNDGELLLWQLPKGEYLKTLRGHEDAIWCLAITPDNTILASGSKDGTVGLWTLPEGEQIATLKGHQGEIWCLAISPDGQILATGSQDGMVKLWSLPSGKLLTTLEGHQDAVWCLAINQQGDLLATGSKDRTVRLWKLPDGENVGVLTGHHGPIRCIAITPDGQMLATGSNDQTLRLWNWDLPRLCHKPIALFNDGDRLWIRKALSEKEITEEERSWLIFMNELINHDFPQKSLKLIPEKLPTED